MAPSEQPHADDVDERGEPVLVAAVACRLHQFEEACLLERIGGRIRDPAIAFGLLGPLAQDRDQFACGCN
jgi:hypothetical protein